MYRCTKCHKPLDVELMLPLLKCICGGEMLRLSEDARKKMTRGNESVCKNLAQRSTNAD